MVKEINRATIENDYLYIYENFGYFKNVGENNYEVYDSPNLESLTSHYYETFSITSKFTGYISDITIGNFFNDLS